MQDCTSNEDIHLNECIHGVGMGIQSVHANNGICNLYHCQGKQAATYAVRENDLNSRGDLEQQKDSEPENAPEQDKAVQEQNPEENLQNMQCLSGVT